MGYAVIPIVASIVLALHHVFVSEASARSKAVVIVTVGVSVLIWRYAPRWLVAATVMQVAVSIYMLLCLRLRDGSA